MSQPYFDISTNNGSFRYIQSETPVLTKGRALLSQDSEYFISVQILVRTRHSTYVAIKRLYKEVMYVCCFKRFFQLKLSTKYYYKST